MKAKIDENKCVGCGICANICPEGVEIINGKANIKDENANCLKNASENCPQGAIILEDENEKTELNKNFNQEYGQGIGRGQRAGKGRGFGVGPKDGRGQGRGGGGRRW